MFGLDKIGNPVACHRFYWIDDRVSETAAVSDDVRAADGRAQSARREGASSVPTTTKK